MRKLLVDELLELYAIDNVWYRDMIALNIELLIDWPDFEDILLCLIDLW